MPSGDVVVVGVYGAATAFAGHPLPAGPDVLVVRMTPAGAVTWAQTLDTKGATGVDVAVDELGDVVVFGGTQGTSFTLAGRTFTNAAAKFSEATFVAKLGGADGAMRWAQAFVGTGSLGRPAYVRPSSGNARSNMVVVGGTFGQTATFGAFPQTTAAAGAGYVVRLDPADGSVKWARSIENAVLGTELSPSGDVVVDATYGEVSVGLDPAPAPPTLPSGAKSVVFAKLAQADGAPLASAWLTLTGGGANAAAGRLVRDAATARYVFSGGGVGVGFGGTALGPGPFLAALDESFTLVWNGRGDGAGRLAPMGGARLAVVGSQVTGTAGGTTGLLGVTFPTRSGAVGTTVLLMGLADATSGALTRGYAVPTTGRVQNGDPGSLRPNGIAGGNDGRLLVSADLDGIVNVDRCDIAANTTDTTLLVFAVGP